MKGLSHHEQSIIFHQWVLTIASTYDKLNRVKGKVATFIFFALEVMIVAEAFSFECPECKNRNYRSNKNKKNTPNKVELKKYCKHCRKHTLHKETK